ANVVLAARSVDALKDLSAKIEAAGGKSIAVACDVSKYDDVKAAVDQAVAAFGSLDILVNNAGLIDPIARLEDSDPESWAYVADVNYKGVYYCIHAALPELKKAGGGTIINVSSGAAVSALEGWSHYCSSKAAVLSLTKCVDTECREEGIRIIGMSPGTVATEMQVSIKSSGINPVSQLDPAVHIPASWPAKAIAWLCGSGGDDFRGVDFSLRDETNRRNIGLID
ncbi:MAG: SDR family oxidoreductase, partial [Alphaproteobacteria bacterium]|nr:SDR family oxidoreductase [Alphaproteobacteria bacterium]